MSEAKAEQKAERLTLKMVKNAQVSAPLLSYSYADLEPVIR